MISSSSPVQATSVPCSCGKCGLGPNADKITALVQALQPLSAADTQKITQTCEYIVRNEKTLCALPGEYFHIPCDGPVQTLHIVPKWGIFFDTHIKIYDQAHKVISLALLYLKSDFLLVARHEGEFSRRITFEQLTKNQLPILKSISDCERIITHFHDFVTDHGFLLYQEFLPQGAFIDIIDKKIKIAPRQIRQYVSELLEGVSYLAERRIVHSDIKPDNVLLTEDNHLKISDFKYSFSLDRPNEKIGGSFEYSPPELSETAPFSAYDKLDPFSAGTTCVMFCTVAASPWHSREPALRSQRIRVIKEFVEQLQQRDNKIDKLFAGLLNPEPQMRWGATQAYKYTTTELSDEDFATWRAPAVQQTLVRSLSDRIQSLVVTDTPKP